MSGPGFGPQEEKQTWSTAELRVTAKRPFQISQGPAGHPAPGANQPAGEQSVLANQRLTRRCVKDTHLFCAAEGVDW